VDKILEFISKARYPIVFLVLGGLFALAAAAKTIKLFEFEMAPDSALAVRAALGLLALAMLGLGVYTALRDGSSPATKAKYDLFLAAPMAGTDTEEEYQEIRTLCLDALDQMKARCGIETVYFVGEKLLTKKAFESEDVAAWTDFDALRASRNFALIYPRKVLSSVIAEAGFALAHGIPSTYFVRDTHDLPYLLTQAGDLPHDRFPPVHIRDYSSAADLMQMIRNDGPGLFKATAAKAEEP
jgi:hypothetical protein